MIYNIAMKNLVDRTASRTEGGWDSGSIVTSHAYTQLGLTKTLRLTGTSGAPENTTTSTNKAHMIQGHTYYARVYEYHSNNVSSSFDMYWGKIVDDTDLRFHANFGSAGMWNMLSAIFTCSNQPTGDYNIRLDFNHGTDVTSNQYFTGVIIVDLTETFGSNIPSKAICDAWGYFDTAKANMPLSLQNGDVLNCKYTGGIISIELPRGIYKLECWGAKGNRTYSPDGRTLHAEGANGGYSTGDVYLSGQANQIFLACGESGKSDINNVGRRTFNGGGKGGYCGEYGINTYFPSGGGATHIATRTGQLSSLASYKNTVLMVAGGGAQKGISGTAKRAADANGGGNTGGAWGWATWRNDLGEESDADFVQFSSGGTQDAGGQPSKVQLTYSTSHGVQAGSAGAFGQGGDGSHYSNDNAGPGGGGGWYGGGGGAADFYREILSTNINNVTIGASGGSGHVSEDIRNGATYNDYHVTNPDTAGDGYIRITVVALGTEFRINYNNQTIAIIFADSPKAITYKNETIATLTANTNRIKLLCNKKRCHTKIQIGDIKLKCESGAFPLLKVMKSDVIIKAVRALTNLLTPPSEFVLSNVTLSGSEATYSPNVTAMATYNLPTPIVGHKYYGRVEQLVPPNTNFGDGRFEYYVHDAGGTGNITFTSFSDAIKDNQWHSYSSIQQFTGLYAQSGYYMRSFAVNATNAVKRRNHMIVDLTATFGAGNEPTKEWCDANIPYFTGTINI